MSTHFAVTITASKAEIDASTYARRLGELLDRPVADLEEAIRGDTVVLERELSYGEALEIQRELSRRRIPAQVSSGEELSGRELLLRGESFGEEIGGVDTDGSPATTTDEDRSASPAQEAVAKTSPANSNDDDHDRGSGGDDDDPGAWAELFPELAREEDEPIEEDDDWASEAFSNAPVTLDDETIPVSQDNATESDEKSVSATSEDKPVAESVGSGFEADATQKPPRPSPDSPTRLEAETSFEEQQPKSSGFDAGKIREAFSGDGENRPPYKPKGYDKRPEHVPLVAAVLSAIAPGAGQVFNGQPEKAQSYAVKFFLVVPWVQSVRQAMKYGEKVRTYYAPRPEPGTGKRAMWFAVKWWATVAVLALVVGGLVSMIEDHRQEQEQRRQARVLADAMTVSQGQIRQSVRSAAEAAEEVEIEAEPGEDEDESQVEYTMDDEERAQRLFIIGYHYCQGRQFARCEQLMSRVTQLVPGNRDAYRLQTWASLQKASPDGDRSMPDLQAEVPTLEEFETQLALEGKDLEDVDEDFARWWGIEGHRRVDEGEADPEDVPTDPIDDEEVETSWENH